MNVVKNNPNAFAAGATSLAAIAVIWLAHRFLDVDLTNEQAAGIVGGAATVVLAAGRRRRKVGDLVTASAVNVTVTGSVGNEAEMAAQIGKTLKQTAIDRLDLTKPPAKKPTAKRPPAKRTAAKRKPAKRSPAKKKT